jgi:tetratricopeptide (TPR) repeat protein
MGVLYFFLPRLVSLLVGSGSEGQLHRGDASVVHESVLKVLINPIIGLGFYLKKMLIPWPLNFHINHVAKVPYFLVGLGFLLLLLYAMRQKRWESLWGWGFLCALLPVLTLTYAPRSWSPLAERYSYFASVFFAIFVGLFYAKHMSQRWLSLHSWVKVLPFVVVFVFGLGTARRTPVWQSSETLLADTYQKSNGSGYVAATYGVMYLRQHNEIKAEEYLQKALDRGLIYRAAFGLGMLEASRGNYEKAEEYYLKAAWPSSKVHAWKRSFDPNLYMALGRLHFKWAIMDEENSSHHYERAVHFYGRAHEFGSKDPMILYNIGKVYLKQGDLERARDSFRQVWEEVPDTYYGKAAGKLMKVN